LAVAIAESCFSSLGRKAVGAEVDLPANGLATEALLFGESPSRIIISFAQENLEKVKAAVGDCPFELVGKVGSKQLRIVVDGNQKIGETVAGVEHIWHTSLEHQLEN
jgi:phosphoribosylformylglycinamidine (FGAM) synthase-like enzyme